VVLNDVTCCPGVGDHEVKTIQPEPRAGTAAGTAAPGREVGWHVDPEHLSEQAYWDGQSWTARRRWSGTAWVQVTSDW